MFATQRGLEARGHTVVPFAMRHPSNHPSVWEVRFPPQIDVWSGQGFDRVRRVAEAIWSRRAARALDALLNDFRPDIAHLHHVHRHLTPSILEPLRRHGVPVVWTVHDYELVCPNGQLFTHGAPCTRCKGHQYQHAIALRCKRDNLAHSAAVALEKWAHAKLGVWDQVDRFVCPSRHLAARLVEFGLPRDRVLHLPNLVEPAPPGGPPGPGWMYAGRLSTEKGVDDLVAVARRLPHRPVRVLGDGPEYTRLLRQAPSNMRFLGAVGPDQVGDELRAAGAVAVPSRWPENDPYAVLEAQQAGRAVVASAVGGIPEQIRHGEDGVLVPPDTPEALAEAIESLLTDPARAAAVGARARSRVVSERAPALHLDRLLEIYRGLA